MCSRGIIKPHRLQEIQRVRSVSDRTVRTFVAPARTVVEFTNNGEMTMTVKTKDPVSFVALVQHIIRRYRQSGVWTDVKDILPLVLWEVIALGDGLILLGKITAKVRLDDGQVYKVRFDHTTHVIQLCPMKKNKNLTPIAVFTNQTTADEVWAAFHPVESKKAA